MRRRTVIICSILGVTALVATGAAALWHTRERTSSYYTDAETIHRSTPDADVRDILWRPAEALESIINSAEDEYEPRLSGDGLTLYFVRGKAGENADIYTSFRTPDGWTEPEPLVAVNTDAEELGPEPSHDGRALYFYSNRDGGFGGYDIWVSHLVDGRWQTPVNVGASINTGYNEYGAAVTPDGTQLYYASNRPRIEDPETHDPDAWPATVREDLYQRDYDLYVSTISDRGIGPARPVDTLNSRYNEGSPAVSPVGDFLYFSSDRPGGEGGFDVYRSRRLRSEHLAAENLGPAVNSPANELDPGVGMGGFSLHFSSDRPREKTGQGPASTGPPRYDLFHSTSREVFIESETYRASIDWIALLPYLIWALLALLLLLLLLLLQRLSMSERFARLSLLAKCLIASLIAHAMLVILLGLWGVGSSLSNWVRDGSGTRVAIVSPSVGSDLTRQVRGGLTTLEFTPAVMNIMQRDVVPETVRQPSTVEVTTVDRSRFQTQVLQQQTDDAADAPTRPIETPDFQTPREVDRAEEMPFRLPDDVRRSHSTEMEAAAGDEIVEPISDRRIVDASPSAIQDAVAIDVETAMTGEAATASLESLHAEAPARDAETPGSTLEDIATSAARSVAPRPPSVDPDLPLLEAAPTERVVEAEREVVARRDRFARLESPPETHQVAMPQIVESAAAAAKIVQDSASPSLAEAAPPAREAPALPTTVTNDLPSQLVASPDSIALRVENLPTTPSAAHDEAQGTVEPIVDRPSPRAPVPEADRTASAPKILDFPEAEAPDPIDDASLAEAPAARRDAPTAGTLAAIVASSPHAIARPSALTFDLPTLEDTSSSAERETALQIDARIEPRSDRSPMRPVGIAAFDVDGVTLPTAPSTRDELFEAALPPCESKIRDADLSGRTRDQSPDAAAPVNLPPVVDADLPALEEAQQERRLDDQLAPDAGIAIPRAARDVAQGALFRPMERIDVDPPTRADRTLDPGAMRSLAGSEASFDAGVDIDPRELMTPLYVTIYAVRIDPALPDETAPPDPFDEAIGIVQGFVIDALTGEPLRGASVRLDLADREPLIITTDASGAYVLPVPDGPNVVAISASMAEYNPDTINVTKRELRGHTLRRDFRLMPEQSDIIVIERDPEVHHLGDDQYSGRANSQFQKRSEGRTYVGSFELTGDQLDAAAGEVTVHLLARGTERNNEIRINGMLIDEPLNHAPRDGSYGAFSASFPADWLHAGPNEISITSAYNTPSDLDDFEFVNIRIDLSSGTANVD
jgi:hypothetical protein